MSDDISIDDYCRAFETWARVSRAPHERILIAAALAHLRASFTGPAPIPRFCRALREWSSGQVAGGSEQVQELCIAVEKSCLLYRLLYAREPLRTRPCPIHRGRWSGSTPDECPAGCSFRFDITGWLPEPLAGDIE